jgi:hypothetical protein
MSDAVRRIDVRKMPPVPAEENIELDDGFVSQTFLNYHDRCDRAAYLYRRWAGGAPAHALNRGTLFHIFAERALRYLIDADEKKLPPETGKEIMLEVLRDNPTLAVPARERDVLRELAWNWSEGTVVDPANIVGVEESMTLQLGQWTIRCRIDLIEQPFYFLDVTDWKTSWAIDDSVEFEASGEIVLDPRSGKAKWGGNFQTQVYATVLAFGHNADGLALGHDIDYFRLRYAYPRWLRASGLAKKECVVRREQLMDFKADLEVQLARMEASLASGEWQPTPGTHCSECPAPRACPLPRHLRADSQLPLDAPIEDAIALAQWWHFSTGDTRDVKRRLKAWAKVNGPIQYADDLELVFTDQRVEEIRDKPAMYAAIAAATEYGEPFERNDHVKQRSSTKFDKRKIPKGGRGSGDLTD